MSSKLSRRDFLRFGGLALTGLAFNSYNGNYEPLNPELWGRVAIAEIDIYSEPRSEVRYIVGKHYRDHLVVIYYAFNAPDGPAYNPVWYRVWGGYVYSAYLQFVKRNTNPVLETIVDGASSAKSRYPLLIPFATAEPKAGRVNTVYTTRRPIG